jgi:hypothetical protein
VIYLACPYTHPDPAVRDQRFEAACVATASLMRAGRSVFSPIVHSHPLVRYGLPVEWDFWQAQDCEHLRGCDCVVVLTLEGWETSVGVQAEVRLANELGLPIHYLPLAMISMQSPGSVNINCRPLSQSTSTCAQSRCV